MTFFDYKNDEMHAEGVALASIAAQVGTPFYCYSAGALRAAWQEFADGIKGMRASVCYAMKANSNLAVVRLFGELGAGADIVSACTDAIVPVFEAGWLEPGMHVTNLNHHEVPNDAADGIGQRRNDVNPIRDRGDPLFIEAQTVDEGSRHPRPLRVRHIVAVGGRTGRDGIHGATFSSAELTSHSESLSGGRSRKAECEQVENASESASSWNPQSSRADFREFHRERETADAGALI